MRVLPVLTFVCLGACGRPLDLPVAEMPPPGAVPLSAAWPTFQHDVGHSGCSVARGPKHPRVLWSFQGVPGLHFPIVGQAGVIYAGAGVVAGAPDGLLYAIGAGGAEIWKLPMNVAGAPAQAADGTLYVASDQSLVAVSTTGDVEWHFPTADLAAPSPTIGSDGTIYVGSAGSNFYAVTPTGMERWHFQSLSNAWSSPALGSDDTVYFGSNEDYGENDWSSEALYALGADGATRWVHSNTDDVQSPAIGSAGQTYARTGAAKLIALDASGGDAWTHPPR